MENNISKERVTGIIKEVLEKREEVTNIKAYITGAKQELEQFLVQNKITEFECEAGTIKINDSSRKGLVRESVESAVAKVNSKEIDHINMSDLTKDIDIHSISIKAKKKKEEN